MSSYCEPLLKSSMFSKVGQLLQTAMEQLIAKKKEIDATIKGTYVRTVEVKKSCHTFENITVAMLRPFIKH